MKDNNQTCFDKLYELYPLYTKVRDALKLVEDFERNGKTHIAPIDQLRSALYHVFNAINNYAQQDEEHFTHELKEIKEHLDRAGYDALELLAGIIDEGITEKLSKYDASTLTIVFPEYYKDIKPGLSNIKKNIASLRSKRNNDSEKSFINYFEQIDKMIEMDNEVNARIPSLEEYENRQQWQNKWPSIQQTIISIVGTLIGGMLVYFAQSFFLIK